MATLVTTLVPSFPSVPAELLLVYFALPLTAFLTHCTSHVSDRGVSGTPVSHEEQRITRITRIKD